MKGDDKANAITIVDMIALLSKILKDEGNLAVGRTGHFGEFNAMDKFSVGVQYDTSQGWENRTASWLSIESPDIGEEPD